MKYSPTELQNMAKYTLIAKALRDPRYDVLILSLTMRLALARPVVEQNIQVLANCQSNI